jgi:hypothetical protein
MECIFTNSIARELRRSSLGGKSNLESLWYHEHGRLQAERIPVHNMVHGSSQPPVIVIFEGDEAEGLQNARIRFARGRENFGHSVHRARLRLKCEFDKRSASQGLLHLQQASGNGNRLKFRSCAASIFQTNRSQDGSSQLDAGSTF